MDTRTTTTLLAALLLSTALAPMASASRPLIYECYEGATLPCWDEGTDGWYLCLGTRCVGPVNAAHEAYDKLPRPLSYNVFWIDRILDDNVGRILP